MIITRKSPLTGDICTQDIDITETAMYAWKCGELIQVAMPNITDGEREFIKTGYTPGDWKRMFHDCPEEDDDGYAGTRL